MHDIEKLARDLTFDEYETGKALFSAMKGAGIASTKAAGLCYRAGKMDAKREARQRRNAYHTQRLAAEQHSPPEANTEPEPATDEEGSITNE